ncbi:hypothetical protein [Corynebacterium tapiri]|uniref:TIGR02569 family protein n=1 Tax=Corynebacterium tapiri TaxID=1448266 RepID=A0A5C4U3Z9_9CORY|nr:hypothetical protein [Corynebacterium tapiri]TNL98399.1 hypothetical protein FHE74_04160 [Corynebacterium tapiri]
MTIPAHVLTAFTSSSTVDLGDGEPVQLGPEWGYGQALGSVVFTPASDTAHFSARVRDKLSISGVRVSRPLRSTDGRFVVGGYAASTLIDGHLAERADEAVAASLRIADSLNPIAPPGGSARGDAFAQAERQAFAEAEERFGSIDAPLQVGHADVAGTLLFDGPHAPGLTDVVPFAEVRPHAATAAWCIADHLIYGVRDEVDLSLLDRFAHIPDVEHLVWAGVRYRELVAEGFPDVNSLTCSNISRVKEALMSRSSDTI